MVSLLAIGCEDEDPNFKNAFWKADVSGTYFEGYEVELVDGIGPGYAIKTIKRHSAHRWEPVISFYFWDKPTVGSYTLLIDYDINSPNTAEGTFCPGGYTNGYCESREDSNSGHLDILKFSADSLVATFAFETQNSFVINGLIKHKIAPK